MFLHNRKKYFIFPNVLFVLLFFGISVCFGQQKEKVLQLIDFANDRPRYCWDNHRRLDYIGQGTPKDELIIVIARLGKKDVKAALNQRRLHNVRAYLTLAIGESFQRSNDKIILAEGERINANFGQLEFYVGGRLVEILKVHPNRDLNVVHCYPEPNEEPCSEEYEKWFYPCKGIKQKQKRKQ